MAPTNMTSTEKVDPSNGQTLVGIPAPDVAANGSSTPPDAVADGTDPRPDAFGILMSRAKRVSDGSTPAKKAAKKAKKMTTSNQKFGSITNFFSPKPQNQIDNPEVEVKEPVPHGSSNPAFAPETSRSDVAVGAALDRTKYGTTINLPAITPLSQPSVSAKQLADKNAGDDDDEDREVPDDIVAKAVEDDDDEKFALEDSDAEDDDQEVHATGPRARFWANVNFGNELVASSSVPDAAKSHHVGRLRIQWMLIFHTIRELIKNDSAMDRSYLDKHPLAPGWLRWFQTISEEKFLTETLGRIPLDIQQVLGNPNLTAHDLINIARRTDEELVSRGAYINVIRPTNGNSELGIYVGAVYSRRGFLGRWTSYARAANKAQKGETFKDRQGAHIDFIMQQKGVLELRAIAVNCTSSTFALGTESMLMVLLNTVRVPPTDGRYHVPKIMEWIRVVQNQLVDANCRLPVLVGNCLNRIWSWKQVHPDWIKRNREPVVCHNCAFIITPDDPYWMKDHKSNKSGMGFDWLCRNCWQWRYNNPGKPGNRPQRLWGRNTPAYVVATALGKDTPRCPICWDLREPRRGQYMPKLHMWGCLACHHAHYRWFDSPVYKGNATDDGAVFLHDRRISCRRVKINEIVKRCMIPSCRKILPKGQKRWLNDKNVLVKTCRACYRALEQSTEAGPKKSLPDQTQCEEPGCTAMVTFTPYAIENIFSLKSERYLCRPHWEKDTEYNTPEEIQKRAEIAAMEQERLRRLAAVQAMAQLSV